MVYLQILCNLILIFAVFEPWKINYARGLSKIWVKTPSFYDGFKLQWKKR